MKKRIGLWKINYLIAIISLFLPDPATSRTISETGETSSEMLNTNRNPNAISHNESFVTDGSITVSLYKNFPTGMTIIITSTTSVNIDAVFINGQGKMQISIANKFVSAIEPYFLEIRRIIADNAFPNGYAYCQVKVNDTLVFVDYVEVQSIL